MKDSIVKAYEAEIQNAYEDVRELRVTEGLKDPVFSNEDVTLVAMKISLEGHWLYWAGSTSRTPLDPDHLARIARGVSNWYRDWERNPGEHPYFVSSQLEYKYLFETKTNPTLMNGLIQEYTEELFKGSENHSMELDALLGSDILELEIWKEAGIVSD